MRRDIAAFNQRDTLKFRSVVRPSEFRSLAAELTRRINDDHHRQPQSARRRASRLEVAMPSSSDHSG